jgi:formylglycine-generating enzyme required for sulfatase activity
VSSVVFCDAVAYCRWAGKSLCGSFAGRSLSIEETTDPDRSAWMNACSAGGTRAFPYGDEFDPQKCVSALTNGDPTIDPDDQAFPVPYATCEGPVPGLFDMSGNVTEWQDACGESDAGPVCAVQGGDFLLPGTVAQLLKCEGWLPALVESAPVDVGVRCCMPFADVP